MEVTSSVAPGSAPGLEEGEHYNGENIWDTVNFRTKISEIKYPPEDGQSFYGKAAKTIKEAE